MPDAHARLGPSSAERWISCPASVRAVEDARAGGIIAERTDSVYSREGTLFHTLAELRARAAFHLPGGTGDPYKTDFSAWWADLVEEFPRDFNDVYEEMLRHAAQYVDVLRALLDADPGAVLLLEQRVHPGVEAVWGTADAVIVSGDHVQIVDAKYGKGVEVAAKGNTQLRLYAAGALADFGHLLGDPRTVGWTVFQPRLGHVDADGTTVEALREWVSAVVVPAATEALNANRPRFGPSPEACRFCPLAGVCSARADYMLALDFGQTPATLTGAELGALVTRLPEIRDWCSAVEAAALTASYELGVDVVGHKVVRSGGKRTITDHAAAIQTFIDQGLNAEDVSRISVRPFGELERLLGKAEVAAILAPFIGKTEGRPSLVSVDDGRPAITRDGDAAAQFSAVKL